MKTIEERAKEYAPDTFLSALERKAYIAGAQEQKAIDNAEWLKIKSSWEREAQINHNDENNYTQGYHDAIERAILWFQLRSEYPISRLEDSFRNFMEE